MAREVTPAIGLRDSAVALIIFALFMLGIDVYAMLINALASWAKSGIWGGFVFGFICGILGVVFATQKTASLPLYVGSIAFAALTLLVHLANVGLIAYGTYNEMQLGMNADSYTSYYSTNPDTSAILSNTFTNCAIADGIECFIALVLIIIDCALLAYLSALGKERFSQVGPKDARKQNDDKKEKEKEKEREKEKEKERERNLREYRRPDSSEEPSSARRDRRY